MPEPIVNADYTKFEPTLGPGHPSSGTNTGGVPSRTVGPRSSILAAAVFVSARRLLSEGEDFEGGIASTTKEDADRHKEREDDLGHESILLINTPLADDAKSQVVDFKPSRTFVYYRQGGDSREGREAVDLLKHKWRPWMKTYPLVGIR
jgi:hypothetical protein